MWRGKGNLLTEGTGSRIGGCALVFSGVGVVDMQDVIWGLGAWLVGRGPAFAIEFGG